MVTQVDPFIIPIPPSLLGSPDTRHYFEYLNRFLHDLWLRTGGGDDSVASSDVEETYPWSFTAEPENNVQNLFNSQDAGMGGALNCITVSTAYTAAANDFINAKNGATITLPQYPNDSEFIIVRNGDGTAIKLNGNGKSLNGSATGTLSRRETCIRFNYFLDSDEWFSI